MEYILIAIVGVIVAVIGGVIAASIDNERRRKRGEPTRSEIAEQEIKQKQILKVENLTNALKEKLPQEEIILIAVTGSVETLIMSELTPPPGMEALSSVPTEKPVRHGDGIFAATDKRLIMYQKKSKGGNLRVFGYDTISAVETKRSWRGAQVVISSDEKMRIGDINSQDEAVEQFTEYIRKKQVEDAEPSSSDPSPSKPTPDIPNQIRGLAELKDQGILTEEEFNAKKQDLLDKL